MRREGARKKPSLDLRESAVGLFKLGSAHALLLLPHDGARRGKNPMAPLPPNRVPCCLDAHQMPIDCLFSRCSVIPRHVVVRQQHCVQHCTTKGQRRRSHSSSPPWNLSIGDSSPSAPLRSFFRISHGVAPPNYAMLFFRG